MNIQESNKIKILKFQHLSKFNDIIHFSTTRLSGKSSGILTSLNLGYTVNDNPKNVTENLNKLAQAIGISRNQMVSPKQAHTKNIGIVKTENDLFNETDALITNIPNICIFVRTADCVPILLFDPVKKAAAAIHSGWKSTLQEISRHTIEIMQKEYGTNPNDLIAGIGPSIGPEVYEIGPEVIEQFVNHFSFDNYISPIRNSQKGLLNLWEVNRQILIRSGVHEDNIEISKTCTFSNPELFYSARRDGVKTGRLATGIMIKS